MMSPFVRRRVVFLVRRLFLQGFRLVHAGGRRTPIIFITAFPEERIRVRAMRAGAIGFLSKPFDVTALIKCLDLALQSNDSAAQN
jgi:FixJ family two-component response regulator